jgi:peroxiredoxin Q/BCP
MGISADRVAAQRRFSEKNALPYPVLADPSGEAIRAYGARGLFGFAKRMSFLIDADGRIAKVYRKVSPRGHAGEVLEDLRALSAGRTP